MAPRQNSSHEKELKERSFTVVYTYNVFRASFFPYVFNLSNELYYGWYAMPRQDLPKVCNGANLVCHAKWTVTFMVEQGCSLSTRCCPTVSPEILQGTGISMTSANPVKKTPPTTTATTKLVSNAETKPLKRW